MLLGLGNDKHVISTERLVVIRFWNFCSELGLLMMRINDISAGSYLLFLFCGVMLLKWPQGINKGRAFYHITCDLRECSNVGTSLNPCCWLTRQEYLYLIFKFHKTFFVCIRNSEVAPNFYRWRHLPAYPMTFSTVTDAFRFLFLLSPSKITREVLHF